MQKIEKLVPIAKAASMLGITASALYERIHVGTLVGYDVNKKLHVDIGALLAGKDSRIHLKRGALWALVDNLWQEGMSDSEIARHIGRSRERVRQIRSGLGKPRNPRRATLPKGTYLRQQAQ
jgi:hypothetical protein